MDAEQAILTGESDSVTKDTEPHAVQKAVYQDKTCLLFSVSLLSTSGLLTAGCLGHCLRHRSQLTICA